MLQTAYHNRSLVLYASLWFRIRATITTMLSRPIGDDILGRIVRHATDFDGETCDAIGEAVPGHDRDGEVRDSTKQGTAKVVHGAHTQFK
ncbi:MAG: hypothetical protein M3Y53_08885 [Thermoproteota archaeon]|nr:hypothetical protein [Thermoproteota archaeon]